MSATLATRFLGLHIRIGLLAAGLALIGIACLSTLAYEFQRTTIITWAQRLNYSLAQYIVEHLGRPLIQNGGIVDHALMKDLAIDTMTVNPSVELYLLDTEGTVVAHALEANSVQRTNVDLVPIRTFLRSVAGPVIEPILGDDPRFLSAKSSFSVAPVVSPNGTVGGYLYVILYGEQSRKAALQIERDGRVVLWLSFFTLALTVGLFATWLAHTYLTRPLRKLTQQIVEHSTQSDQFTIPQGGELTILNSEFNYMQQRIAQQFNQLKINDTQRRDLIANISHDMRTPLSGIQGYIELASQESAMPPASRLALQTALKHCKVMNKRIDDLLTIARLGGADIVIEPERFSLRELLCDIVAGYQVKANAASVLLTIEVAQDEMGCFECVGDIGMFERMFQNLLDNALIYTELGGRVWIELQQRDTYYAVRVVDTGLGMTVEQTKQVFARHWSGRSSTGLGLTIVQRIAELHKITLDLRSRCDGPQKGSSFELKIPFSSSVIIS
jgi:signal transduction histidine kinase